MANVAKSKTMNYHKGEIYMGMLEEAFTQRIKGEGATYRERLIWHIP